MVYYPTIDALAHDLGVREPVRFPDFLIFRIEDYFGNEPVAHGPYRQDFFEVTFATGQNVDVQIGTASFNATQNALSFTAPRQLTSWQVNGFRADSLGYMILFRAAIFGPTRDRMSLYREFPYFNLHTAPMLLLNPDQCTEVLDLMGRLWQEHRQADPAEGAGLLAAYLLVLLEKVKRYAGDPSQPQGFTSRAEEVAYLFEQRLKERVRHGYRVADYADELHLSTAYLAECVREVTGRGPTALIQEYLMLEARALLRQSNQTVATIADELGFGDASNFTRFFKKHAGVSPQAFRQGPQI